MNKINFESISKAMQIFDTDTIEIFRSIETINSDGTTGNEKLEEPIYKDIPCHISFITKDNPNPEAIDSQPIITMLKINCDLSVDLQKGDYIIAKKLAGDGTVLETYNGVIGFPQVSQSRKAVLMEMRSDV